MVQRNLGKLRRVALLSVTYSFRWNSAKILTSFCPFCVLSWSLYWKGGNCLFNSGRTRLIDQREREREGADALQRNFAPLCLMVLATKLPKISLVKRKQGKYLVNLVDHHLHLFPPHPRPSGPVNSLGYQGRYLRDLCVKFWYIKGFFFGNEFLEICLICKCFLGIYFGSHYQFFPNFLTRTCSSRQLFYLLWETYSILMPIVTRYTFSNSLKSVDPLLQPPLKNPRPAILQPNKTCVCVLPPTKYLGTRLAQQICFSKCRLVEIFLSAEV